MSDTAEVTFSQLVQHPRETIENMRSSGLRTLHLSRRDAEDLVLMWASRAAQEGQLVDVATKLFTALMRTEDGLRQMTVLLPEVFPWVGFLPDEDVKTFAKELTRIAGAAGALENPAPLTQLITEWRHTAEVYVDPALYELLVRPIEDHGLIAQPGATL